MNFRSSCLVAALALSVVGCGEDLYEEETGSVDLAKVYGNGTAADPTASLPRQINPSRGWVNGARVEYYDFGSVTLPRKVGTRGEALRVPDAMPIEPMYFFYDSLGRPLFSKPAFDPKTNGWFMPGGKNALDPAPNESLDPDTFYSKPYPARPRSPLYDDQRGSSSYQRPVIDVLPDDPSSYSGLWEVVEVTVSDSKYEVDDVKSGSKVREAIEDGKLVERHTGFVINCPVLDERTAVTPSALYNNIPRPRIEVWYRTKLGSCFLVNGWESIGETVNGAESSTIRTNLRLFNANEITPSRVNTLEVIAENIGNETRLSVPVAKLLTPTVSIPLNDALMTRTRTRYPNDDVGQALPRHTLTDGAGYSPIVWQWDINVPQAPEYVPGTYRNFADLSVPPDPFPAANPTLGGGVEARDGGTGVVSRNMAVIGAATKCVADADCKFGQTCNVMPDTGIATLDPPAGQNIADVVIQREGGPRCDVPAVGFGGYCSPGISRCDVQAAAGSDNEVKLKALGVASAGPTFTVHADLKTAETNLANATSLSMGVDPADAMRVVTDAEKMTATMQLPGLTTTRDRAADRVKYYDEQGFTKDLPGWGYLCYPGATGNGFGSGFCMIRCDSTASGTVTEQEVSIQPKDKATGNAIGEPIAYKFRTEPRCGGANMLGYRCLPSGTVPERQRVCVRECNRQANTSATYYVEDPAPTLAFNSALCDFPINEKAGANTAFALSGDLPPLKAVKGQECLAASLSVSGQGATTVRACAWNPDFEPRRATDWQGQ